MSEKFDALLKKLAATADDETIHALLVDATVVRPDAMEQLEEEVKTVCRAGQMPEATAIRLVTKMREVSAATVMRPMATQVLQDRSDALADRTELLGAKTELLGSKTDVPGAKTELLVEKTRVLGPRPEMPGEKTELLGAKTELFAEKTKLLGPRPEMPGERTELLGAKTELLVEKTKLLGPRPELPGEQTELLAEKTKLLGPRPELPGAQTEVLGAKTELIGAKTQMLGPKPELPGASTEMLVAKTQLSQQAGSAETAASQTVQDSAPAKTQQIPTSVQRRRASDAANKRRASESLGPGAVLKDRYILKREIGRGGMGTVYAAEDRLKLELGNPEPMVAVKVLQARLAVHEAALMALEREAAKAQALAHPNVGTVFGFDRDDDVVFVTMELLTGSPLDEVIRNSNGQGIGRARSMKILAGIANGLAYAHAKGLVHADLKPSNIFLTEDDIPKILDLGIARAVPGANNKKDSFDVSKLGAYTAAYATAEMIEGSDPNKADDVYALGLIAYEMLTSKHPYQRVSAPEAQKKGLKPAPIKGLSRREWALIRRSVAFTRAERPADAAVFQRALGGISRLQQMLTAATLVLVLVAAYFGYARYQASGPDPFDPARPEIKAEFEEKMKYGDEAWSFFEKGEEYAWAPALQAYSDAYTLHPRDRDASRALRRLAKEVLERYPESRTLYATQMAAVSEDYLANYGPVKQFAVGSKSGDDAAP